MRTLRPAGHPHSCNWGLGYSWHPLSQQNAWSLTLTHLCTQEESSADGGEKWQRGWDSQGCLDCRTVKTAKPQVNHWLRSSKLFDSLSSRFAYTTGCFSWLSYGLLLRRPSSIMIVLIPLEERHDALRLRFVFYLMSKVGTVLEAC